MFAYVGAYHLNLWVATLVKTLARGRRAVQRENLRAEYQAATSGGDRVRRIRRLPRRLLQMMAERESVWGEYSLYHSGSISISPRGDWRKPSDAAAVLFVTPPTVRPACLPVTAAADSAVEPATTTQPAGTAVGVADAGREVTARAGEWT
jgi:hypothetical protein